MASDAELMLQELDGLKDTVSSVYRDRLSKLRTGAAEESGDDTQLCPQCGEEIPADAAVCPECEADLEAENELAEAEKTQRRKVFDEGLTRR